MSLIFKIFIACILAMMAGCKQNSSTPIEPSSLLTYQPKGTITGLINNAITATPVAGAVLSLGYNGSVQQVTSDGTGAFSFADVPVGQYQITNGQAVISGKYTMTVSLVNYNATQSDPNKKYRNYYYDTVTVKFTSLGSGDSLAVSDMVGSALIQISYLNTTVTGQVVDQNQQPVANATVMLYDATGLTNILLADTTTSSSGTYLFSAVDNGLKISIQARTSDGSLQGTLATFTLPASLPTNLPASVNRIILTPVDKVRPFVVGIMPENSSDVSPTNLQVVYTFSEPIEQTAYTRTNLPLGSGTIIDGITIAYVGFKKTTAAISFSAQWNASFTQLTLTPQGIVGSAKYTVDATTAFNSGKIMDNANNPDSNNTQITGDFEVLQFTTNGSSIWPGAPVLTRPLIPGLYGLLDFQGGKVELEWNYDSNARSYNIYKSVNGGSFELLHTNVLGLQDTANTEPLIQPNVSNPFRAGSVTYIVCGVSKDLVEGPSSNSITVKDDVQPQLLSSTSLTGSPGPNSWTYTLRFTEPLNISTAENVSNYFFIDTSKVTFTVNNANYLGYSGGVYLVQLGVTTSSAALPSHYSLFVTTGVTDLAGNGMNSGLNSKSF